MVILAATFANETWKVLVVVDVLANLTPETIECTAEYDERNMIECMSLLIIWKTLNSTPKLFFVLCLFASCLNLRH